MATSLYKVHLCFNLLKWIKHFRNPETHSRPLFGDIYQSLCQSEELVLNIPCDAHLIHPKAGIVGASLEAGENLYIELQKSYLQV